jgi:hypothetical protein
MNTPITTGRCFCWENRAAGRLKILKFFRSENENVGSYLCRRGRKSTRVLLHTKGMGVARWDPEPGAGGGRRRLFVFVVFVV